MRQAIEIPMQLPTPNTREYKMTRARRVKRQRRATRNGLDRLARRFAADHYIVTLIRISTGSPDSDRSMQSLAAVRDEVARWLFDVPFEVVWLDKEGNPKLDKRGRVKMRAPRAPDGPNDPITWRCGQQKTKKRGYQAVQIIIEGRSQ